MRIAATIFLYLLCAVFEVAHGQVSLCMNESNRARALKLKKAYIDNNCLVFFNCFPKSFSDLCAIYDYKEYDESCNLYSFYDKHIDYLFNCKKIYKKEVLIDKIILISIDGEWRADAIGLFQANERKLIINNTDIFLRELNKRSNSEQRSLWHFIFDGSPPHDKQIRELYKTLFVLVSKKDALQARIMKEEFYKMYH
ncbi:hypothetical protein LJ737_07940 [Hymenobacter sp. 15J16-1T3B]|uniref:hypothetical protein n=1 Tax=Hymenobacter sp. 15J16-1T3B TaxID=2886941 RepID=UPI001D125F78|nr:hypothetical protein [Hymenobacter sp. 15J16-1T3B]MCC3157165.1 hypothetical protein [Hymenobacter sp. 15J16-1T3B]